MNKSHKSRELSVFSTRVDDVDVELYLRLFSINVQACADFLQQQSNEQTKHVRKKRNDEFTQPSEHREEIKDINQLIDENQFIHSILFN